MRILLVGCGALGGAIARGLTDTPGVKLAVYDQDGERARLLAKQVGAACPDHLSMALPESDVVVEAASQQALRELVPLVLRRGLPLVALSVGVFADADLLEEVAACGRQHGGRLYVPSGAVGGLDVIRAAAEDGLHEVTLETAKPPQALGLPAGSERRVLFEGIAAEAVRLYPKNVNVAAVLSLAGLGFERTRVRIVADPALTQNTHTVTARGNFGTMTCRVENAPSPDNPASSHLASLAALALLRRFMRPMQVGT